MKKACLESLAKVRKAAVTVMVIWEVSSMWQLKVDNPVLLGKIRNLSGKETLLPLIKDRAQSPETT